MPLMNTKHSILSNSIPRNDFGSRFSFTLKRDFSILVLLRHNLPVNLYVANDELSISSDVVPLSKDWLLLGTSYFYSQSQFAHRQTAI